MEQNKEQTLKSMKFVYTALVVGVASFIIIAIALNQTIGSFMPKDDVETIEFRNIFLIVANVVAVAAIFGALQLFKSKMAGIDKQPLMEKLAIYRSAMIVRTAMFEAPAFMFIVGYMLTGCIIMSFESFVVLIIMLIFYPSNIRIARETQHDVREFN